MTPEERARSVHKAILLNWRDAPGPIDPVPLIAEAIRAAVDDEREACALLASEKYSDAGWNAFYFAAAQSIAAAIRERGRAAP